MAETNLEGVFYDMPASRYHMAQGVSNSMLKHLARSPAHLQAYLDQPEEQTPAMLFGQIVHQLLLEPDKPWTWAVRPFGLTYSRFIDGVGKAGILVDRKVLSDLAIREPAMFQAIVEKAKAALPA